MTCSAPAWGEISVGHSFSFEFAVTQDEMARFGEISGDRNPLHCDPEFARSKGFDGVVVYGALLVAKISRLLGMNVPGMHGLWTGLDIRFNAPLLVGETALLTAEVVHKSEAARSLRLDIRIEGRNGTVAKAKADSLYTG